MVYKRAYFHAKLPSCLELEQQSGQRKIFFEGQSGSETPLEMRQLSISLESKSRMGLLCFPFPLGRPNVPGIVGDIIQNKKFLITACEPPSMRTDVWDAAARHIGVGEPNIELHAEAFVW